MTKGKKQQRDATDCDISLRSSTFMSDDDYLQVGSVLGMTGRSSTSLLVDPHGTSGHRLGLFQTPLGRLPRSLMATFGLDEALTDLFLQEARPYCSQCGGVTHRSEALDVPRWPDHGYIAVVVDGIEESVSLEEQCALLDVERAVVDGLLVRREDIAGREGEPVLTIASAPNVAHIPREVDLWFARGGGAVRLVHYASRGDRGVEIQRVFKGWRCPSCGVSHPIASRQEIEDAPACQRCRGEGWLLVEDGRFVACDDCDAFGRTTALARYDVCGVPLKNISESTFESVKEILTRSSVEGLGDLTQRIGVLCDEGFAHYPIGTPVELLSRGERVLATVASARLSSLSDVELVIDGGSLGVPRSWVTSLTRIDQLPVVRVVEPAICDVAGAERPSAQHAHVFTLREIVVGPLSLRSLSIDIGGLTVIQGEPGVGKSLLLREIARRFSKRRKLAHLGAFGVLKRCHHIESQSVEGATVMELLGVDAEISEQVARSRHARERGLSPDDFMVSRSRHRCEQCKGVPMVGGERCSLCDGTLFDRLVGSVVCNNVPFAELIRGSLARAAEVLWADDTLSGILGRVPDDLKRSLSLGDSVGGLAPPLQRFLVALGSLARLGVHSEALDGDLLLIDVPFATTSRYQRVVLECIKELHSRGATIVCAGVPDTLENIFSSVIRLRFVANPRQEEGANRFLDTRMTRKSEVFIER